MSLALSLDSIATLSDQSIKELISAEIDLDVNMKHKDKKITERQKYRNSEFKATVCLKNFTIKNLSHRSPQKFGFSKHILWIFQSQVYF